MSVPMKGLPSGGAKPSNQNPWSDALKKPVTRNTSSGVLKLGSKFENLNNSEKTTFPKPPPLKPVAISKPQLNPTKPSLNTGSTTATNDGTVERSSGLSGLKPKPLVSALHSKLVQENIQKVRVERTLSSDKPPNFLSKQRSSPRENKSADFSAEDQKDIKKPMPSKLPFNSMPPKPASNSMSPKFPSNSMPPKLPNLKPNFVKQKSDVADGPISKEKTTEDSTPKIKPLPNVFALGKCPSKPKRPAHVNLDGFTSISTFRNDLSSPESVYLIPIESDTLNTAGQEPFAVTNPSLPGSTSQEPEQANDDEDMYEDLEERWAENEQTDTGEAAKEDKKKCDKEKKQQQKEAHEKKEREARKKFKLSGAVEVLQEVKARLDCKGGKNELPLTQGETIEIVRITHNPEGLWLGRNSEGLYGFVKIAALKVDHSTLTTSSCLVLNEAGEVYDDVGVSDGGNMNFCFPPPPAFGVPQGNDDDVYDDVDSQTFPPPLPPLSDHPTARGAEEMDGKKKKKLEKEEKEFRKKFKYDGDINVLYQVVAAAALTSKWGSKDLPLKPGDVIDVIVKPQDGKLIGRNKDGKFGYVCLLNIQQETDIYDDVGEDCIYDN
ncbi:FYN-binding protein 1 [Clupea harengus]|uniref:FYN-binding protein 1 n=1 Tax=Clupea harengus TaxID=7950 RepID=A0A8M1KNK9_CLUHA|nr:FYN-binding protein 1 [Clupea harengus]